MRPGDRVAGRFEIVERAASGGMGAVFRARDLETGGDIAFKILHAPDEDGAQRLMREGAALAKLEHPHIVKHVAHGTTSTGLPFVAMEWVEGETLGKRLARERLKTADAISIGRAIALALGAAHEIGIVHRDIKPSNVMLVGDRVMVVDFGLARLEGEATFTASGVMLGTPAFMAPEQARGDTNLMPAADVFSLGAVLYRCLSGQNAFQGDNAVVILGKVLLDDPRSLAEIDPTLPPALVSLVERMLSKDPRKRPRTGYEVDQELATIVAGESSIPITIGTLQGEMPTAATSSHSIGRDELRIVSIVVAGPISRAEDLSVARALGEKHGVHVERLRNGSLLASASGRATITDQVSRMGRMALALRDELDDAPIVLATGRGTVKGEALVGEVIERAGALLGDVVRGAIRIDRVTASLMGSRFEIREDGERTFLQGEREELQRIGTVLGRPSPYVGRERELSMIESLFDETIDDKRASVVVVTAHAGLGKSRLGYELVARLRMRGDPIEIWSGTADTASDGAPYLLLSRVLRSAVEMRHGESLAAERDRILARVSKHVPDAPRVAAFLGEMMRVPFAAEGDARLRAARQDVRLMADQIMLAWLDFVGAEASVKPVVVVLDDMHWSDLPTVKLVDAALRAHRDKPLFVLVLARPEVEERFPRLFADRNPMGLALRELPARGAEKLARALLAGTDEEIAKKIAERSAGSPLLIEELVRAGALQENTPDSALAIVQARVEGLADGWRRLLRAASVQGNTFDARCVAHLLATEVGELADSLKGLVDRELVVPMPARGIHAWSFRHAIMRDAAYAMLVESDRTLAHRLTAEWLSRQEESEPQAIADHFERGGEGAAAIPYLQKAAERALEANDFAAVIAWAERAIACGATGETRALLRMLQADAHVWRGEDPLVEDRATEAMSLFVKGSRGWYTAIGALGFVLGRFGKLDRVATFIQEFFATTPAPDAELERGRAAARICVHVVYSTFHEETSKLLAVVDVVARAHPEDVSSQARAAALHANFAAARDEVFDYMAYSRTAAHLREQMGDLRNALQQRSNLGDALIKVGAFGEAEETLSEAIRQADRMGLAPGAAIARYNLSRLYVRIARYQEALVLANDSIERFERMGDRRLLAYARHNRADVYARSGHQEEAERDARWVLQDAGPYREPLAHAHATLARILLTRGAIAEAMAEAEHAMTIVRDMKTLEEGDREIRLTYAMVLHASGAHEHARAAIREAKEAVLADAAKLGESRETFLRKDENASILALAEEWT